MIDSVDLDGFDDETKMQIERSLGNMNGMEVLALDGNNFLPFAKFETRIKEPYSFGDRKQELRPMMERITEVRVEFTRTNSDGSANSAAITVKRDPDSEKDKDVDNSSETNNDKDNRDTDITNRDREKG